MKISIYFGLVYFQQQLALFVTNSCQSNEITTEEPCFCKKFENFGGKKCTKGVLK